MAKRPLKLSVRIPNFRTDARLWRRAIHSAVADVQKRRDVSYTKNDKLQVEICFYLRNPKLTILDLDNRVKDVCDALQGFIYDKGKGV